MLIKSLHIKNTLSFRDARLELKPITVLTSRNGAGKSNLLAVVDLLRSLPTDAAGGLRRNGPTASWLWQGTGDNDHGDRQPRVQAELLLPDLVNYNLAVHVQGNQAGQLTEELAVTRTEPDGSPRPETILRSKQGKAVISHQDGGATTVDLPPGKSALGESRDPDFHPAFAATRQALSGIKLYRNWNIGPDSPGRQPQSVSGRANVLEEDFSNLIITVHRICTTGPEPTLAQYVGRFDESILHLDTLEYGDWIHLEAGQSGQSALTPANRLSNATIRFIALAAILLQPSPPPLIGLERPELLMRPDSLPLVAELLTAASERSQVIVTTHSQELTKPLAGDPNTTIVECDHSDPELGTAFR